MTDADGDVLSYAVDIVSLELERADGDIVQTLPVTTRVDFAELVELSELLTAPRVPPGVYVRGAMTLDFTDAEVVVEQGGEAVLATVVDVEGNRVVVGAPDSVWNCELVDKSADKPFDVTITFTDGEGNHELVWKEKGS